MSRVRPDLQLVAELIAPRSKVLDLGCGDGTLLEYLVQEKCVHGRGIELSEEGVLACVRRGLSVRQGNMVEGLADYPDQRFDYVILSQTLPFVDDPVYILEEMLRVGARGVVSFPNWGNWRCRLELLLTGSIPQAPDLPEEWYEAPRWQAFTISDFERLCLKHRIRIVQQAYLVAGKPISLPYFENLLATTAVFVVEPG